MFNLALDRSTSARHRRSTMAVFSSRTAEIQQLERREVLSAVFVTKAVTDHTVVNNGNSFIQTFMLKNTDNAVWTGYTLVRWSASDKLGVTSESIPVPTTGPGQTVSVSVFNVATKTTGGSRGAAQVQYWELTKPTTPGQSTPRTSIPIVYNSSPLCSLAKGKLWTEITINPNVSGPGFPNLFNTAYTSASLNPYVNIGNGGQCTAFVYGRSLESLGVPLSALGNGAPVGQWMSLLRNAGFAVDQQTPTHNAVPTANSIAIWVKPGTVQGHVAYVETVSGTGTSAQVTLNEANVIGFSDFAGNNEANSINNQSVPNWGAGYDGGNKQLTASGIVSRGTAYGTFMGYVRLR